MTECKILLLAMRSWGELGNWLSANALAEFLRTSIPRSSIRVCACDDKLPELALIGQRIKAAIVGGTQTYRVCSSYFEIMEDLARMREAGAFREVRAVKALEDSFGGETPDLVVGTKGILARIACDIKALRGDVWPVVNYVTNHGHFRFRVHECPGALLHIVRLPFVVDEFLAKPWIRPGTVFYCGYLLPAEIQRDSNRDRVTRPGEEKVRLLVLGNRDSMYQAQILEAILHRHVPIAEIVFVGLRDPAACDFVASLGNAYGVPTRVLQEVPQNELFEIASGLVANKAVFIGKGSPNAIMEAVYLGLPVIVRSSGLPIEDWAVEMVEKYGIGRVISSPSDAAYAVDTLAKSSKPWDQVKANIRDFTSKFLDQSLVQKRLFGAFTRALHHGPTSGSAESEFLAD